MNRCLNQILTGVLMGLIFFVANQSNAEDHPAPVTTVQWEKLKAEEKLKSGEVVDGKEGQSSWLKIVNTDAGLRSIPLCVIDAPAIKIGRAHV